MNNTVGNLIGDPNQFFASQESGQQQIPIELSQGNINTQQFDMSSNINLPKVELGPCYKQFGNSCNGINSGKTNLDSNFNNNSSSFYKGNSGKNIVPMMMDCEEFESCNDTIGCGVIENYNNVYSDCCDDIFLFNDGIDQTNTDPIFFEDELPLIQPPPICLKDSNNNYPIQCNNQNHCQDNSTTNYCSTIDEPKSIKKIIIKCNKNNRKSDKRKRYFTLSESDSSSDSNSDRDSSVSSSDESSSDSEHCRSPKRSSCKGYFDHSSSDSECETGYESEHSSTPSDCRSKCEIASFRQKCSPNKKNKKRDKSSSLLRDLSESSLLTVNSTLEDISLDNSLIKLSKNKQSYHQSYNNNDNKKRSKLDKNDTRSKYNKDCINPRNKRELQKKNPRTDTNEDEETKYLDQDINDKDYDHNDSKIDSETGSYMKQKNGSNKESSCNTYSKTLSDIIIDSQEEGAKLGDSEARGGYAPSSGFEVKSTILEKKEKISPDSQSKINSFYFEPETASSVKMENNSSIKDFVNTSLAVRKDNGDINTLLIRRNEKILDITGYLNELYILTDDGILKLTGIEGKNSSSINDGYFSIYHIRSNVNLSLIENINGVFVGVSNGKLHLLDLDPKIYNSDQWIWYPIFNTIDGITSISKTLDDKHLWIQNEGTGALYQFITENDVTKFKQISIESIPIGEKRLYGNNINNKIIIDSDGKITHNNTTINSSFAVINHDNRIIPIKTRNCIGCKSVLKSIYLIISQ